MKKYLLTTILLLLMGVSARAQEISDVPLENFSLFSSNYQMKDYAFALPYGKYLIKNHPKTLPGLPSYQGHRTFDRMIKIYTTMAEEATNPAIRSAYLDSAKTLFELVFVTFNENEIDVFEWYLNRGYFYQANADYVPNGRELAVADYRKLLALDENKIILRDEGYYAKILVQDMVSKNEKDAAVNIIEKSQGKVDASTAEYFDRVMKSLFSNPEERLGFLEKRFATDPENIDIITDLFMVYSDLGNTTKATEMGKILIAKNPTYRNMMRVGDVARKNGDYKNANLYFEQAVKLAESNDDKSTIHLLIADNEINLGDLRGARDQARLSVQFNPNNGNAYFKIAESYANAVSSCVGSKLERQDKVVYWLVMDYLDRAKRADPTLATSVNRQIASYAAVAPNKEDILFAQWKPGSSIRVDGSLRSCYAWIGESTTVR
jgi:tetratricopeptide (TPR) repeat protein